MIRKIAVNHKLNKVPVKIIVTHIPQVLGDAVAFIIKSVGIVYVAGFHECFFNVGLKKRTDKGIGNIILNR